MDRTRYFVGLLVLVTYPPGLAYWFLVHPGVRCWRRLGLIPSCGILAAVLVAMGAGLYRARAVLLSGDLGANGLLSGLAALVAAAALGIEIGCRRVMPVRTLIGVPELRSGIGPRPLLRKGVYARVRHPRYLGAALGLLAAALFANYVATYALFLVCLPVFHVVTVLEERELVERFGEQYRVYRERVPRFLPRLPRKRSG